MKIHLVRTKDYHGKELKKVYDLLFTIPGALKFIIAEKVFMYDKLSFEWEDFFSDLIKYRQDNSIPENEFIVVITTLKNKANWFSASNPNGTNEIFIDASDWEHFIYANSIFPIAYEVVANIIQRYIFRTNEDFDSPYIHQEPIGCINDFCKWKPDITYKLRTADICSDCISVLEERLPEKDIIRQSIDIIEHLRNGMLFSKLWRTIPDFEEHLPFPIALTKRKLGMTQQAYTKLNLLIQHFDSLARSTSIIFSHLLLKSHDVEKLFQDCGLNGHPSLGHWVGAIKKLSESATILFPDFDLPTNMKSILSQIHKLFETNEIVSLRNDLGHGYIELSDHIYISMFKEKIQVATEIENLLYPIFRRFHIYMIISADIKGNNQFDFRVLNFAGSNSSFVETEAKVTFSENQFLPTSKKVYLVSTNLKAWVNLDPHWRFDICPTCRHQRFLVTDGAQYLDPLVGHRVLC